MKNKQLNKTLFLKATAWSDYDDELSMPAVFTSDASMSIV
jgi:hypothetical protein